MSMFLLGVVGLWGVHPRQWLKQGWWLLALGWVGLLFLSYFWSENHAYWSQRIEIKLPFLLLPLAISFIPAFSAKQLRVFTIVVGIMLLMSTAYSVFYLVTDFGDFIQSYRTSKVLPTLAKGDHIRFSLCVLLFIIWCVYIWPRLQSRGLKWFTGITVVLLSIYLHLLAARTGLMLWYLFLVAMIIYLTFRKNRLLGIGIIVALAVFAWLATEYIPTLRNRVGYFNYTYILVRKGEISAIYSDMNRFISYDISTRLIKEHPLTGVGAGDIMDEMQKGYDKAHPGTSNELKILPHNQFLAIGLAAGIPAMLLFIIWVFAPLKHIKKNRDGFFFLLVWLVLFLPMLVEPMLEIQYGVFVYLFFLLWQRHIVVQGKEA